MSRIKTAFLDLGYMDTLSNRDTPVHNLDPRAKLLTTLIFIITVISFGKHEISALVPFFIFPAAIISIGNLPFYYLFRKLLIVTPFAIMIGIFNPLIDREILMHIGSFSISGGWISFASIMLRFALTAGSVLVLIACTGFNSVCMALDKMGAPRIFAVQLLFLYRYIFVLINEASRVANARSLRSFDGKGKGIKVFSYLLGHLLLRTIDRAQRIHLAMLCRGFDGEIKIRRRLNIGTKEVLYTLTWSAFFILMRIYNVSQLAGKFLTEFFL
ncbi:MAG: cobalt ECF transporter T component CbiQ [Proteobacteria bacterium]|nr:cobalt ECF transporter T component CbiQ [Pseudomonadota bacterium]MBU1712392.1 cobalt ECF transporter T component CbiQ [Pseudomonadota bacterium]